MREYTISKTGEFPHIRYIVTDYYVGLTLSGGPIIAYFIDEGLAKEYIEYKNKQRAIKIYRK